MYQIERFHSFLWASGGCFSDFYIHNIDECCWMKDAWPVEARAIGGRHYKSDRRGEFVRTIQEMVRENLAHSGLQLESVSLTRMDQAAFAALDDTIDREIGGSWRAWGVFRAVAHRVPLSRSKAHAPSPPTPRRPPGARRPMRVT